MDRVSAARYDQAMWAVERAGLKNLRAGLLSGLRGDVLELGVGTGANLAHYPEGVRLAGVDLRAAQLAAAAQKHTGGSGNRLLACADAERLPFPDESFDAVVGTLVFCSIARPDVALAEVRRVLRPDGALRLVEHVRGQTRLTRLLTDALHPLWFAMQGECHLNRETATAVRDAGFRVERTVTFWRGVLQAIDARVERP
jgi:ubiquinone/menaquinone biosynthesis C-methylase UbiE